jgi:WS/DGAT/MGAT family acyltransferase
MASKRMPLSPVDNAWLRMEDPINLMMITGVLMLADPLPYGRLRTVIEQRLLKLPRFRQRVVTPLLGPAYWEDDPNFDVRSHLHRIALPAPGGRAALQDLVGDLMSTPLDRSKPPWQFHLVEGYDGGSAIIARLHHCIADGIALVGVLLSMTDDAADALPESPLGAPRSRPLNGVLGQTASLTGAAANGAARAVAAARAALTDDTGLPALSKAGAVALSGAEALARLALLPPDPKTPFKGRLGVAKRAAWSEPVPVAAVKQIGQTLGGTVNDILLTAAAGALRRYLLQIGEPVEGLTIRAAVPVNLRPISRALELGNQFGLVFVPLPLGVAEPVARLLTLRDSMEEIKNSPDALVTYSLLNIVGALPPPLQFTAFELFGSKVTAVMTNVPGPRQPIYLGGSRLADIMFWVPQAARLGMGVSILSYNGNVRLGVATDERLVSQPDIIVDAFHDEFEMLLRLARDVAPGVASLVPQGIDRVEA